jgi:hypothetical protein
VNRPVTIAASAPARPHVGRRDALGGRDRLGHAVATQPQAGGHRAGRDRVDPDPARAELLGQRLGQVGQRRLGRRVVDHQRVGQPRVHRAGVDDHPAAGREHHRESGPDRPDRGHHVEVPGGGPHLVGHRQEPGRPRRGVADVVDQHVDPLAGRRDELGRAAGIGQVDLDRRDPAGLGQLLELGGDPAGPGHDVRALGREAAGDREADAGSGAGDHDVLAGQVEFHAVDPRGRPLQKAASADRRRGGADQSRHGLRVTHHHGVRAVP